MDSENLSNLASLYAKNRGITLSTLGTYLAGDGKFFGRLSQGRVTIRRAEAVLKRLSAVWPADLPWPSDIPRPYTH